MIARCRVLAVAGLLLHRRRKEQRASRRSQRQRRRTDRAELIFCAHVRDHDDATANAQYANARQPCMRARALGRDGTVQQHLVCVAMMLILRGGVSSWLKRKAETLCTRRCVEASINSTACSRSRAKAVLFIEFKCIRQGVRRSDARLHLRQTSSRVWCLLRCGALCVLENVLRFV